MMELDKEARIKSGIISSNEGMCKTETIVEAIDFQLNITPTCSIAEVTQMVKLQANEKEVQHS